MYRVTVFIEQVAKIIFVVDFQIIPVIAFGAKAVRRKLRNDFVFAFGNYDSFIVSDYARKGDKDIIAGFRYIFYFCGFCFKLGFVSFAADCDFCVFTVGESDCNAILAFFKLFAEKSFTETVAFPAGKAVELYTELPRRKSFCKVRRPLYRQGKALGD